MINRVSKKGVTGMTEYVTKEAFEKFKAEDFAQVRQDLTLLTVKVDTLTTEVAALPTTSDVKVLFTKRSKKRGEQRLVSG